MGGPAGEPLETAARIRRVEIEVKGKALANTVATLATYNEAANLEGVVRELLALPEALDVLVIDDGSPDGTGALADRLAGESGRVHVIHRRGKLGLGTAVVASLRWAMEHGYRFAINLDADGSHDPQSIAGLLAAMDRCDIAVGSRYVRGGRIVNWGTGRRITSRLVNTYARFVLGTGVRDSSGSFRCYDLRALEKVDLNAVRSKGYAFFEEMLVRCRRAGLRLVEVPITFTDRQQGSSKAGLKEKVTSALALLRLTFRR